MQQNEQQQPTTDVTVYQNSIELFRGGADILQNNITVSAGATAAGSKIIADIAAAGSMTAELDARCDAFMVKLNQRITEMNTARTPITQLMTMVQKMFTTPENAMTEIKKQIQQHRNAFAQSEAKRIADEKRAADLIAAKKIERVKMDAFIELELKKSFITKLGIRKQSAGDAFNAITLETIDTVSQNIRNMNTTCGVDWIAAITIPLFPLVTLTVDDFNQQLAQTKSLLTIEFSNQFNSAMEEVKRDLIDKLPSKRSELTAIANANATTAAALVAAQKKREDDERIAAELAAANATAAATQTAEMKVTEGTVMANFEKLASVDNNPSAELRSGYDITILHPSAWVSIFQLWFENEGSKLTSDEIGTKKMDSMKTWCEKHAHKTNTFIESKFIVYVEKFTAKTTRKNAAQ